MKRQYPFGKKAVTFIAGGSGITPVYQALTKLLNTQGDTTQVTLILGNKSEADVLLKDELAAFKRAHPGRFNLVHIVGGHIDEAAVKASAAPPSDGTLVFVCGPPGLYDTICGPRLEKELGTGTVLKNLGFTDDMVVKL